MLLQDCAAQSRIWHGQGENHIHEGIHDSWYAQLALKCMGLNKQVLCNNFIHDRGGDMLLGAVSFISGLMRFLPLQNRNKTMIGRSLKRLLPNYLAYTVFAIYTKLQCKSFPRVILIYTGGWARRIRPDTMLLSCIAFTPFIQRVLRSACNKKPAPFSQTDALNYYL